MLHCNVMLQRYAVAHCSCVASYASHSLEKYSEAIYERNNT